jgi:hypothetical protein
MWGSVAAVLQPNPNKGGEASESPSKRECFAGVQDEASA